MTYTKQTYTLSTPKPHDFIGSKVRGAFGYALKEEVCINPTMDCKGCFAAKECVFYSFYEAQNMTHNYRLDFKLNAKKYKFSLLLFNDAQKHKTIIAKAMANSLQRDTKLKFKEKLKTFKTKKRAKSIKLKFLTPLRMKKQNRFATRDIELLDILLSIHKRHLDLNGLAYERVTLDTSYKTVSKNLHYQELTRRSNKQKTTMHLGGLMGEMIISGMDEKVYNLLKIGEVIGVGKSTVFGLGKIKVEDLG